MPYFNDGSLTRDELLRILSFSPVPTGIYAGPEVTIVAANDAMLKVWGKERSVIGQLMYDALPELRNQPFIDILKEVIRTGVDFEAKDHIVKLEVDGILQTYYFDFVYKAVKMEDGSYHILNTAKDVTDRWHNSKKIEQLNKDLLAVNHELKTANQALEKAKNETEIQRQTLYDFIMNAPSGICVLKGENLVFDLINNAYQHLLPARDLTGEPLFEALPELVGQPIEKVIRSVYENGVPATLTEIHVPIALEKGGDVQDRYFTVTYQPSKNGEGIIDGVLAFVNDVTDHITARKKLEHSEQHFRQLADLVPSKISNSTPTGEVLFLNKLWSDFSGRSMEDLYSFGYRDILHPDDLKLHHERVKTHFEKAEPYSVEYRMKNKDGEWIWHLGVASPVIDENGKVKLWVASSIEIEHIKREEQRKTDFVNMFSHELKTPITSIKGYVQFLLMQLQAENNQVDEVFLQSSLSRIDKLVKHLTALIEEMLDFGRIESGRSSIVKSPVDLNALVHSVVNDASFINPQHQIRIHEDVYCTVEADADKLGQVITNFISNAVKYAPESRKIDVHIFSKNNQAAVSVKDYGIGIDKAEHEKIFDRFYRVQGRVENKIAGFGIGLFIANSIIKQHDGHIDINSGKGKGSEFTFYIPLASKS